jgi:uncharacterized membrane protein
MLLFIQENPPSDWLLFFGRFHPLVVHLPIGFLVIAGVLEVLQLTKKITMSEGINRNILLFSAITATLACVFGYFLSLSGGYDAEILDEHKWQGIWVAILATVAWVAKTDWLTNKIPMASLLYGPAVVFSLLMIFVAGHHGGVLTHGSTYLTEHTPEPFRAWMGMPPKQVASLDAPKKIADINNAKVFDDIIHPIMKGRCEACHNASKSKGGLRMDTNELFVKGGENGVIFVAGDADNSEMMKRILLPDDDDHHMPPVGKPQLTPEQVKLVKWWIAEGASFDKKVSELKVSDEVKPLLAVLGGGTIAGAVATAGGAAAADTTKKVEVLNVVFTAENTLFKQAVEAADAKAIEEISKTKALIYPVAQGVNYLEVNYVNNQEASDANIKQFAKVADQIVWVKLGDTKITDAAMQDIAKMKNVTRLSLENTKITDAGLRAIKAMPNLEYLNLTGTGVTDAGVRELATLKNLKKLYLWQTKATPAVSLPNVVIDRGLDEKAISEFTKTAAAVRNIKDPYPKK